MESSINDNDDDNYDAHQDNKQNRSKCPKCLSGDMIEHPSFLSMPFTSPSKIAEKLKTAIEDQDADFVFRFVSCRKCGYSEFYVVRDAVRKRI
ncbi:MAG: zinc ribbon domain-containing protein [Thermoproteota archaeon]|nr:zinc ribbon domain-containing protein [Thermoproteota archaeon]MDQ3888085.1 zinc ribbon domain-containing protein [Thermoproteota archaeon]